MLGKTSLANVEEVMTDLVIMELLAVSAPFRSFFIEHTAEKKLESIEVVSLRRSVMETSLGETDVELVCREPHGRRTAFLIENKVRAPIMPSQFERYGARGRHGVAIGAWDAFRVCLISPRGYFSELPQEHRAHIDVHVSYETIRDWIIDEDDPALAFKAYVFEQALANHHSGYVKQPDLLMMRFYESYWRIASAECPELRMPKPNVVGRDGSWIYFPGLYGSNSVRPIHKFKAGGAELVIKTRAGEMLMPLLEPYLTPAMGFRFAKSEAMVTITVPPIDHRLDFALLEASVREALRALKTLRDFAMQQDVRKLLSSPRVTSSI